MYGVASDPAEEAVPVDCPGVAKMGNKAAVEVPPPGAGLTAVTGTVPADAISAWEIAAVDPAMPTKRVVRLFAAALPFHWINVHGAHPVPLTPSKNAGSPATALDGANGRAMVGVGREAGAAKVKVEELEVTVELETVTFTVPGNAESADEIAAVSCVALRNVVGRGDPFQFTPRPFTKFVPVTVNVRPE